MWHHNRPGIWLVQGSLISRERISLFPPLMQWTAPTTNIAMCNIPVSFCWPRSRVEEGRGGLGHVAWLRFPSPLIEPDMRISRIRLSDWFHLRAHGVGQGAR